MDVYDPPHRPCLGCEEHMDGSDSAFDTWGDEPNPYQVIAYECDDCGHVSGYYREVNGHGEMDIEFSCSNRDVYDRLYGESPVVVRTSESGDRVSLPPDLFERLSERDTYRTATLTFVSDSGSAPHTVERGCTLSIPSEDFDMLYDDLFDSPTGAGIGDGFLANNIRIIRQGSERDEHFQAEVRD